MIASAPSASTTLLVSMGEREMTLSVRRCSWQGLWGQEIRICQSCCDGCLHPCIFAAGEERRGAKIHRKRVTDVTRQSEGEEGFDMESTRDSKHTSKTHTDWTHEEIRAESSLSSRKNWLLVNRMEGRRVTNRWITFFPLVSLHVENLRVGRHESGCMTCDHHVDQKVLS